MASAIGATVTSTQPGLGPRWLRILRLLIEVPPPRAALVDGATDAEIEAAYDQLTYLYAPVSIPPLV